ncbi:hypothetical protein GCM10023238_03170 [Streptomyces heliomycini]
MERCDRLDLQPRADLERAVRTYGWPLDTERALRALRDAGHDPQDKHTRQILRISRR